MKFKIIILILAIVILISGCLGVRQSDLDAWRGAPVKALDVHPLFGAMDLNRFITDDGYEIRNYKNEETSMACFQFGCVQKTGGCNNQFIIHKGYVIEYKPTGYGGARCYTDETTRPEK